MSTIEFSHRQTKIIEIVKRYQPITSENIAKKLNLTRATLRTDLALLTMLEILIAKPKVGYIYSGKSLFSFIGDSMKKIKVKDVKSSAVAVLEETSIYDAIVTLFLEDVGTIFIQSKEQFLLGVVSRKDFLKSAIGNQDIHRIPVGMIMTRMPNVAFVYPEDSIYDAALKIINHEIDSLPVVQELINEKGKAQYKIIGKISKTNITKKFVQFGSEKSDIKL
ncbi:MAG TPA: helix-turn-helix transcriptional regulator [Eubacteriaceae bacterium]|nr:helix-turn-helix transcriptional regulator [Eubacteriaceae bacterium]